MFGLVVYKATRTSMDRSQEALLKSQNSAAASRSLMEESPSIHVPPAGLSHSPCCLSSREIRALSLRLGFKSIGITSP